MSLVLAFTLTTFIQFVFVFSKMNYWAAFKGLSYGYPYMYMLLILPWIHLVEPSFKKGFSVKHAFQSTAAAVCVIWMLSQAGFQIYNLTQVPSGRTYFNPDEPLKRSNRAVDYDPAIANLDDCLSSIKGKTVWVATPSVWTWEYLNLVYGSSVDWYPLFANNHYAQNGLIHYGKVVIPQPDYLLVDSDIALVKTYSDEYTVICQTDQTMLIQPHPELWNRAFYIGHHAPYNKVDYRYDSIPVGVDASDVLIYSPGKQDIQVNLSAKMAGKYAENNRCKIEVTDLNGVDILSLPCSMENEAVNLPLNFGVNQYRVAVSNIDDRSPEIINFRIVEISYSLASMP